jgi:xylulokinase
VQGTTDALIGLDIGTTSAKAALFDLRGHALASAERTYGVFSAQAGWVEQNPEEVWAAVLQLLSQLSQAADDRVHIAALAVASQSGSLTPVDAAGQPACASITWMDSRSEALAAEWVAQGVDATVRRISGWHIHGGLPLATLAWLHQHNPDVYQRTAFWWCMNEFIVQRLCGHAYANPSNAGVTQLLEVTHATWSVELCDLVGVSPEQFAPLLPAGAVLGPLHPAVSRVTGLAADVQVVNGGHDQSCTALALGVREPGQVLLACGTSWVITDVVAQAHPSKVPDTLDLNAHVVPQRWTVSQSLGGLGAALEWLVNLCWQHLPTRAERYAAMQDALQSSDVDLSAPLFLPIAGGHRAPAGQQCGGFVHLQLAHTRASMARAVMEGAAFELRLALEQVRRAGMPIDALWMVGGATHSAVWPQLVADVTGLPLRVTHSAQLPAVGAAMLAGWGVGCFGSLDEAQACFVPPVSALQPDKSCTALYEQRYAAYRMALHSNEERN